jgi:hypothetical protein
VPLSLHLPVFPFAGSSALNRQTRVRFWTDPSEDQYGRIGWSDDFDLLQDFAKRLRLADDLAKVHLRSDLVFKVDLLMSSRWEPAIMG